MILDRFRKKNEQKKFQETIEDGPVSRLALAAFSAMAENPESIPRSVFRAKGLARTTEQTIPAEARKLVAAELSRTVDALVRGMPEEEVKAILYPPQEPSRKNTTE